jgi:hypothetical protein
LAHFATQERFDVFLKQCEDIQQTEMATNHYDTFSSLIRMYGDYKTSGLNLFQFVPFYNKDLSKSGLSCVGLSLSLIEKLRVAFPMMSRCMAIVSCEEAVKDHGSYVLESPNNLKEHVLVVLRICLSGNRLGYIIFEPGYHVSSPVVAMEDELFPHTSWFTQSATGTVTKEYSYQVCGDSFLVWHVRENRSGKLSQWSNLIYVKKAFQKGITITQKRALFYSFKSLVIRNRKGPVAGIYCWMKKNTVTIFYDEDNERKQVKLCFSAVGSDEMNGHLTKVAKHFRKDTHKTALNFLKGTLSAIKTIVEDCDFVEDLLELDEWLEDE